ncbi:MAG: VacJ family lipoprotein [Steroidobacteraceae bacterium]
MPLRLAVALATVLAFSACTSQPLKPDARDPIEKFNRSMYSMNEGLDRAIARPVARTYRRITPAIVQTGVSNFWSNVNYPTTIVNQFLQGKPRAGFSDLGRFLLNTVAGAGGLLDPATAAGLDRNDEDFGQTLGKWGVPAGPYLMLPILGPSTFRDGAAKVADRYADPVNYVDHWEWRYGLDAFRLLDRRARLLPVTDTLQDVYDPYAFVRGAFFQQREYAVHDGNVQDTPADEGIDLQDDPESTGNDASPPQP